MNQDEDHDTEMYFDHYFYNDTEIEYYPLYDNETLDEPWIHEDDGSFIESSGIFSVNEQSDYGIFSSRKSSPVKKNTFCQTYAPPLNIFFCNVEIFFKNRP